MGSWILAPFSALAAAAAASELIGRLQGLGSLAGAGAGMLGPAMTTYTAVLLADTAVPGWHEAHRELPFVLPAVRWPSAGGDRSAGCIRSPGGATPDGGSRRGAGAGGPAPDGTPAGHGRRGLLTGRAGAVLRASRALTVAGVASALVGTRSRVAGAVAGVLLKRRFLSGLRYGVFTAGMASAEGPQYTVVSQRQRMDVRVQDAGTTATS